MLRTGYHSGWMLANGIRTHYSWAGAEGPAVVLLHGGGPGSSGEVGWRLMLPALAEAGFRAFAPYQVSFGQTDARPHAWPMLGHQSLVDHVRDFIEALCLDEVCVAGNSQGAYIAVKYAIDHPEKVRRAFLIGSGTISGAMKVEWPGVETNPGMLAIRNYDYTEAGMRKFLLAIVNDPATVTDELVRNRTQMSLRPGIREARGAFEQYTARMRREPKLWERFSLQSSLPKLAIPAKFIWGIQDKFAPMSMGQKLAELCPNIKFDFVDGGHQTQTDNPEVVNQMVIGFFSAK
ncbi:MAG: alpha/beta fold hydrolase [Candidatus Binataceae bacterium]